jgi:dTDP-glucose pyrophosphorylase/predicted transcriptional regulator
MRKDWRSIRVHPQASIMQTMAVVSDGRLGIALVVDENDILLGTVTDGDMRRAILRQVGLDESVSSVMQRQFTAVGPEADARQTVRVMRERSVKQVPVCEDDGRVLGIYILDDLIEPVARPSWAVIMAGGQGKRLWPLTSYLPKPMLPVGTQPLLELILAQLQRHGFQRVFIAINYQGDQITRYFGNGQSFGCSIEYLCEEKPLGTGGPLSLLPERPEHPLLVTNGDLLTDVDLSDLMDFHQASRAAATLGTRELVYRLPYGVVHCEGNDVVSLAEKPTHRQLVNAGIYVFDPELLAYVPVNEEYQLPSLVEEARNHGQKVKAYRIREQWLDVGQLEDYERVRRNGVER